MNVENIKSPRGNKVANQFVIHSLRKMPDLKTMHCISFQSYTSDICYIVYQFNTLRLFGNMWDYSYTTRKYFKQFINEFTPYTYETKAQWEKEIKENDNIEVL